MLDVRCSDGSWFLVLGSWFLVLGSWFLVPGSMFLTRRSADPPINTADFKLPIGRSVRFPNMSTVTAILEPDADGTLHLPVPQEFKASPRVKVVATFEEPGRVTSFLALILLEEDNSELADTEIASLQHPLPVTDLGLLELRNALNLATCGGINDSSSPPDYPNQESAMNNEQSTIPTLRVEHLIQDAGTPGIEDFAREINADFYQDGELVFSSSEDRRSGRGEDCWLNVHGSKDIPARHTSNLC